MKRELPYYEVEGKYGWDQDDFPGFWMKLGGCAAVTACDSCIYLDCYKGISGLYPFDSGKISRKEYLRFAEEIRQFLYPRMGGINRLEIYIEEFGDFLKEKHCVCLQMAPFPGTQSAEAAQRVITAQIDQGLPIPYLLLRHKNKAFNEYIWHWFMLTGYQREKDGPFLVKAVTFGKAVWLNLDDLWDTGYEKKGGLILFEISV